MIKGGKRILIAVLVISPVFHPSILRAEIQAGLDFSSRYIWRGFDLNPYKEPVLQPSLDYFFGNSGISLQFWASLSFQNKEAHEFDLTLSWQRKIRDRLDLSAGFIHYGWYTTPNFRFGDDTSHEFFLMAALPDIFFQPELAFYYDFTNGDGIYLQLEVSRDVKIFKTLGGNFSASIGYNGGQWLAEETQSGISDFNCGISLPLRIDRFQIAPFFNMTAVLLEAIGKEIHWWYGISVTYEPPDS